MPYRPSLCGLDYSDVYERTVISQFGGEEDGGYSLNDSRSSR